MKSKNALLLAAVSAFALTMTTTTANATYRCSWTDDVKYCGNDRGFVPATDGETIRRDRDSGDREPASREPSRGDNEPSSSVD
jgi:hypothetical protein